MGLGRQGKRVLALPRVRGTARVVGAQNFVSMRRVEGLRQWASKWNSALCYEDGLDSQRNKLAVSSTSNLVE